MFGRLAVAFLVLGILAGILGFGLVDVAATVQTGARAAFFVLLFLFVLSLVDVMGQGFRRG